MERARRGGRGTGARDRRLRLRHSPAAGVVRQKAQGGHLLEGFLPEKSWGRLFGCADPRSRPGEGDKYIPHYFEVDLGAKDAPTVKVRGRLGHDAARPRIYQLFVRLFGNLNETRQPNGTLAQQRRREIQRHQRRRARLAQGAGVFARLADRRSAAGHRHRLRRDRPTGRRSRICSRGIAGSPYAIKDYFDVCPDYAVEPKNRLAEFKALLERLHAHGLKALIDFVPNHVARCYHSDIKPEIDFGTNDDRTSFFDPRNNFFYLQPDADGPPLQLPTCQDGVAISPTCKLEGMKCDGLFQRRNANSAASPATMSSSWKPGLSDWYETVKLNYGFDFTDPAKNRREYPNALTPDKPIPNTWTKMDQVIAYWQAMGVDGFRCDMAHMEPPEFWKWLIHRARERSPDVFFIGEAYDNDPAKVPGSDPVISQLHGGKSNVMFDLLDAGFDAVYDDPSYKAVKNIYDGRAGRTISTTRARDDFIFENSIRYAENHDEVRLAGRGNWGGIGMKVGRPVAAILYGLWRGPVMLYNGQEVGEPAAGAEGFGGDDARTSIFDYWSMPELVKWANGHKYDGAKLSEEQEELAPRLQTTPAAHERAGFSRRRLLRFEPGQQRQPALRPGRLRTGGRALALCFSPRRSGLAAAFPRRGQSSSAGRVAVDARSFSRARRSSSCALLPRKTNCVYPRNWPARSICR